MKSVLEVLRGLTEHAPATGEPASAVGEPAKNMLEAWERRRFDFFQEAYGMLVPMVRYRFALTCGIVANDPKSLHDFTELEATEQARLFWNRLAEESGMPDCDPLLQRITALEQQLSASAVPPSGPDGSGSIVQAIDNLSRNVIGLTTSVTTLTNIVKNWKQLGEGT